VQYRGTRRALHPQVMFLAFSNKAAHGCCKEAILANSRPIIRARDHAWCGEHRADGMNSLVDT